MTTTPDSVVRPLDEPLQLGRYRLCFELGSGGMATVFMARAEGPGGFEKIVAVKRIHPHLAKEKQFVEMFLDEARISSRINHPNVCSVFDFGIADHTYYMAMEFVLGETVARLFHTLGRRPDRMAQQKIPALAAQVVAAACEGLHAAHELRGDKGEPLDIVHRDVSPSNLFVSYDGTVKVVDFGVARAAGALHHTVTGAVRGKWAYMAPEQAKKLPTDRRADVWSLGVILWELVTGRRLFRRETEPETIVALMQAPIPPPSRLNTAVSARLDAIILRALSRDREARYATARDLGRELTRFLRTQGEGASTDLAECMQELFREERARRQELIDQARRAGTSAVPKISEALSSLPPIVEPGSLIDDATRSTFVRPRKLRLPPWWVLAVIAVINVLLGVALFRLLAPGPRRPPSTPTATVLDIEPARARESASPSPPLTTVVAQAPAPPAPAANPPEPEPTPAVPPAETAPASAVTPAGQWASETRAARSSRAPTSRLLPAPRSRPPGESRLGETVPQGALGVVNVATPGGWADVYLGGRKVGRAPTRLNLPAGEHVIELRPFGELPARRSRVSVPPGETTRLVVRLSP